MVKVRLKGLIKEYSDRNKDLKCNDVYSVTNSDGFIPSSEYFSKEVFSKDLSSYKKVYKNSLAFNPSRINVGSVAVQSKKEVVVVSPLYTVLSVEEKHIFPLYLECFLHSNIGLQQIKSLTEGSVRDILKFSSMEKMEINLPSLEDQKNFISKIGHVNKLIIQCEKQLSDYDLLIKSRFIELFGDPLAKNKWNVSKISEIAPSKPYKESVKSMDNKYWLLNLDAIESNTGVITEKMMVMEYEIGTSTNKFSPDNVLYSKLRPYLNKVVIPDDFGYATTELIPLYPNKMKLNKIFLANLLRSDYFLSFIKSKTAGAKMPRVSMDVFWNVNIIVPPIELQNQFADFVNCIDKSKLEVQKSLGELETLKKSLIQQYFG